MKARVKRRRKRSTFAFFATTTEQEDDTGSKKKDATMPVKKGGNPFGAKKAPNKTPKKGK